MIVSGVGAITIENVANLLSTMLPLSVTRAVKMLVPGPVGVPDITPLAALRTSPAGSIPEIIDHV